MQLGILNTNKLNCSVYDRQNTSCKDQTAEFQQQELRIRSMREEYSQAMTQSSADMDSSRKYMENIEAEQHKAWETYSHKLVKNETDEKGKPASMKQCARA